MVRKRFYAVGALSAVALLGGAWATGLIPPDSGASPDGAAAGATVTFDASTAKVVDNNAYGSTSRDANGVFEQQVSLVPVQVKRDGAWVPASNVVAHSPGSWTAPDHPLEPKFPDVFDPANNLEVTTEGHAIGFALQGDFARPQATVDAAKGADGTSIVSYNDVTPGTDLQYQVEPGTVKESFVLSAPPTEPMQYSWIISSGDLTATRNDFGGVNFSTATGEVVAHLPVPGMWDSSGEPGALEANLVNIDYDLTALGNGKYLYVLKPNLKWLTDPSRVYPVFADPSVAYGTDSFVAYKKTGTSTSYIQSTSAPQVGNPQQAGGWSAWRTVIHWPYENLFPYRITGASMSSTVTGGTANCYGGEFSLATASSWAGRGTDLAYFPNCGSSTGGASSDLMTSYFSAYVAESASGGHFMLSGDEGNAYSYKTLRLTMTLYYVSKAVVTGVAGLSPVAASTAAADTPQRGADEVVVQATGTESTGTGQQFQYAFASSNGGVAWTSPWLEVGAYRVPDTALTPGKDYSYTVLTRDKLQFESPVTSNTDPLWRFHVRAQPAIPASVTVDGQALTGSLTISSDKPTLAATVTSPEAGPVWAIFTVKRGGVVVMDGVTGSHVTVTAGGSGVSSVTLPYAITAGSDYTVEVKAFDGHLEGPVLAPSGTFTGPPRTVREIPGSNDGDTGATS